MKVRPIFAYAFIIAAMIQHLVLAYLVYTR